MLSIICHIRRAPFSTAPRVTVAAGQHKPIVISGCSGSGKTFLISYLCTCHPGHFKLNLSYTTRPPRPTEQHGRDYMFCPLP